jgi:bacillithiol biosynthesis cysteine-adding enzyme BshC
VADIFEAYLGGNAPAFYRGHFANPADRRAAVARAVRPLAPAVAAALEAQNARLAPSPLRDDHLAQLRRGAAAVVTGQQMGLFLGPLFTFYKAASAVRAARALTDETGRPVVPVFWLQTEDHDLPEVAECHVPCGAGAPLTLRLPSSAEERISIAHRALPEQVRDCLGLLRDELANLPHAEEHLEHLGRHYRPGAGWSTAFAGLLSELFAEEGLVLVDPRDAALARVAAEVHRHALERCEPIATALDRRGRDLAAAGVSATVHIRPGAPLSFFHPEGHAGPRYRLTPSAGGFAEVGGAGVHSLSELFAALESDPLRFSTSVLLRPLVQDTILPTAAFVGGPAEVAYFAQLAPLYDELGVEVPLVVPRARLRVLEARTTRLLARLGLAPEDVSRPEDELLAAARGAATTHLDAEALAGALRAPFETALAEVRARVEAAGAGLAGAVEKTRHAVDAAISRLAGKYEKALLHADQAMVDDLRALEALLQPGGVPQERCYGLAYFAARWGEREFTRCVLAAIDPFDAAWRDLPMGDTGDGEAVGEDRREAHS